MESFGHFVSQHFPGPWTLLAWCVAVTLITSAWCEYFLESGAEVGISLDGPQDIHDSQRPRRHGKGSFDEVMRGLAALRNNRIGLNALCVLTPTSLSQPERMFEFFLSQKIVSLAFNVEEIEGEHGVSLLTIGKPPSEIRDSYSTFMKRFLDENERNNSPLTVREFHIQSNRLLKRARDRSFSPDEPENCLGRIVTVSRDGEVSSWSPELASGVPGNVSHFSLGNVNSITCIDELLKKTSSTHPI